MTTTDVARAGVRGTLLLMASDPLLSCAELVLDLDTV